MYMHIVHMHVHVHVQCTCMSPDRYDLGEEHAREKERYAAKEREDVIRKSKERKLAETKVTWTQL